MGPRSGAHPAPASGPVGRLTPSNPQPPRLRVLHLLKTSVGARWALTQMRELLRLGVEVHAAMPDGPLVDEYRADGIVVHLHQFALPFREPWRWPAMFAELRSLVDHVEPDVLHSHFLATTVTMRLALGRRHPVPRLFQVPGPLHLEYSLLRRLELATAGPSDSWIGSCLATNEYYRRAGVTEDRLFLAYYGVDLDSFSDLGPPKLRSELGIGSDTRLVGMVSYMYGPRRYLGHSRGIKGHEDLVDALALLGERRSDVLGVFVGGAWNEAFAYERQVRDYGGQRLGSRACFLGTRHDVVDLYPDLDVVVHPSHSDNVGGTSESLLLGVPTVATDVGGFPDLVTPGVTGWLVPRRDPPALAGAIAEALDDPDRAHRMAAAGQVRARQVMDIRNCAAAVLDAYRSVCTNARADH